MRIRARSAPLAGVVGLALLLAGCGGDDGPLLELDPKVQFAPQRVLSPDYQNVAYHLDLAGDAAGQGFTLVGLDVLDGAESTVLATYEGDALSANLLAPTTAVTVPIALVWLQLAPTATVPDALIHHLRFVRDRDGASVSITGAPTTVDLSAVRVIAPPVRGARYLAMENTSARAHHDRQPSMVDGATRMPQRFAVDYVQLTTDFQLSTGDGTENPHYPSWGADLLAVADGTVAEASDGMDDWPGWVSSPQVPAGSEAGNHVILDIGQGQFAVYAHCQKGTVVVAAGDTVTVGQTVCKMGNTGMSNSPHLHFQISNAADFFHAESVPYVLDHFVLTGFLDMAQDSGPLYSPLAAPRDVTARLPDYASVVDFDL